MYATIAVLYCAIPGEIPELIADADRHRLNHDVHTSRVPTRENHLKLSFLLTLFILQVCCIEMTGMCEDGSSEFISIEDLLSTCGIPRTCHAAMDCEGKIVRVRGFIDYDNVYDQEHYPNLPYEKFTIRDREGHSIEIWAVSNSNREIFREINRHKTSPDKMAYLEGTIVGFDMPTMGKCQRGIRINIAEADKIFFR